MAMKTKICNDCNLEFGEEMAFCMNCGHPLNTVWHSSAKITNCEFSYKCPLEWVYLTQTDDDMVRYCTSCEKNVHFVTTQAELNEMASLGKCVAFNGESTKSDEPRILMGSIMPNGS
jgi:hypothetical protein